MSGPDLPDPRLLRRAVGLFRRDERRRVHPPVLHVGELAGRAAAFEPGRRELLDADLRREVVTALLGRAEGPRPPVIWLTRMGELTVHDDDLGWLSACTAVCGEAGVEAPFVVITRRGWVAPVSGAQRSWVRLRLAHGVGQSRAALPSGSASMSTGS